MIATGGPADVRIHFENLTDPRRGEPTYPLLNVVVMTLCAVISGADDFVAIARWSTKNRTWLESAQKGSAQKGTFYFSCCFGLPLGRSEDSRPSIAAVFACQ